MKQNQLIFTLLTLMIIAVASLSFASQEVKGRVREMKGSHITIANSQGSLREFSVTKKTTIFVNGMPSPVKHILPNSVVRIFVKDGTAEAIFLQEVPK